MINFSRISRLLHACFISIFLVCIVLIVKQYVVLFSGSSGPLRHDGEILGGDFIGLYSAGKVALKEPNALYDFAKAFNEQELILRNTGALAIRLPFAYPPILGAIFECLANVEYRDAFKIWFGISAFLGLLGISITLWTLRTKPPDIIFLILLSLSFAPLTIFCLAGGQTSMIGLLLVALMLYFFVRGREFEAGMTLGLCCYKPPLFLMLVALQLLRKNWQVMRGACLSGILVVLSSWMYVGTQGMTGYFQRSIHYLYGAEVAPGYSLPPNQGVGVLAGLFRVFPQSALMPWMIYGALFIAALCVLNKNTVKTQQSDQLMLNFSLEVSVSLLFSIQMLRYDISILLIPIIIVWRYAHVKQDSWLLGIAGLGIAVLYLYYFISLDVSETGNPGVFSLSMTLWVISLFLFYERSRHLHRHQV